MRCRSRLRHIQAISGRLLHKMVATIDCLISFAVVRGVCVVVLIMELLGVAEMKIGWAGCHLIIVSIIDRRSDASIVGVT